MATEAQMNANRENAQKSTGPRTPEGKAISSRNARKPCTAGRRPELFPEENIEYAKIGKQYIVDLKPVGILEESLVETITDNHFQINRARAEIEALCGGCRFAAHADFEKLLRVEKRLEMSTLRAAAALRAQQKARKAEENYGTTIRFEDEIKAPYQRTAHGHLPRAIGFVPEETELFVYFQQMEEESVVKVQEYLDDLAARTAKRAAEDAARAEPPPPTEAVIG